MICGERRKIRLSGQSKVVVGIAERTQVERVHVEMIQIQVIQIQMIHVDFKSNAYLEQSTTTDNEDEQSQEPWSDRVLVLQAFL